MPYIPPEQVAQAKEMDLHTYLQRYDPDELVHVAGKEYCTKTHDSLRISNGCWAWNSRGIYGRSAVDYLIKVRGMSFLEAVEHILRVAPQISIPARTGGSKEPLVFSCPDRQRKLILPVAAPNNNRVITYLSERGIDGEILDFSFRAGQLYQSADYGNCVFVGMDKAGQPRYAALRGTSGSFKGEASGSDKRYSFSLPSGGSEYLHLFESAIDLLSYATLLKMHGRDWQTAHLLSLAGVFAPAQCPSGRLPVSLARYLEDYPGIRRIDLHLDNDLAGRTAAQNIVDLLGERLEVRNRSPPTGKDVNEYLCQRLGVTAKSLNRKEDNARCGNTASELRKPSSRP